MVYPVVGAAQRVLAPRGVVLGSKAGALEVIQPAHGDGEPIVALLDKAV